VLAAGFLGYEYGEPGPQFSPMANAASDWYPKAMPRYRVILNPPHRRLKADNGVRQAAASWR
jgi:hypothetical protein